MGFLEVVGYRCVLKDDLTGLVVAFFRYMLFFRGEAWRGWVV